MDNLRNINGFEYSFQEIGKFQINDFWLSFPNKEDKIIFGYSTLPQGVHITMSFGVRTNEIDFHLTKNTKSEVKHVPLYKIKHENLNILLNILVVRLITNITEEVTAEIFAKEKFIPLPSKGEESFDKIEHLILNEFNNITTKKTKKKAEYKLEFGENESKIIMQNFSQIIKNNIPDPKITMESKKENQKYYLISNKELLNQLGFLTILFGESFGNRLVEKWHNSLKLLDLPQKEINDHDALEITPDIFG